MDNRKQHFAYIVQCGDGTLYAGYSTDVAKRVKTHNKGKGAKYTRARLPVVLVWESCPFSARKLAMIVERHIKSLPRAAKVRFIKDRTGAFAGPVNHSLKLK